MSFTASRVDVTTSPTLIYDASGLGNFDEVSVLLKNRTGSAAIFLGGSAVTTTDGFQWDAADTLSVDFHAWGAARGSGARVRTIYGVVATTTQTVHVLAEAE